MSSKKSRKRKGSVSYIKCRKSAGRDARERRISAGDVAAFVRMAGIANNLNQLAHTANTAALNGQRIDVFTTLLEIKRQVEDLT